AAEECELWNLDREIRLEKFFEILTLFVVHDVVYHSVRFLVLQWRHVDALDITVDTNDRRNARRQMQVRGIVLDGKGEQLGNIYRGHGAPSATQVSPIRGRLTRKYS